jgi:hemolysin III
MAMVYLSSTLFHAIQHKQAKRMLQVWDHISIFMLIAGTYTPMVVKFTDKSTALVFLGIMWSIVAVGSLLKLFFTAKYELVSVALYVVMGWMAVFIFKPITANMPSQILWWLVFGGLAYTLGVIFFLWKKLTYSHAIWHVFVLTGTVTHFFAVYNSIPVNIKL